MQRPGEEGAGGQAGTHLQVRTAVRQQLPPRGVPWPATWIWARGRDAVRDPRAAGRDGLP